MEQNLTTKPANQIEYTLFTLMGEALCKTQVVEQALSHSITLKTHPSVCKEEADQVLNKNRSYTLGKAIKLAQKDNLYSTSLQKALDDFLELRNWLVHNAMAEGKDSLYIDSLRNLLFQKIKSISNEAFKIQHAIELDMINFCESRGRDMSKILAVINERSS
jgi:hypothetical protein